MLEMKIHYQFGKSETGVIDFFFIYSYLCLIIIIFIVCGLLNLTVSMYEMFLLLFDLFAMNILVMYVLQ